MKENDQSNQYLSDDELALRAQQGSAEDFECLLTRYKPLVRSQASRYFLSGGDRDDLIQEGMIGLFKAVRVYDVRTGNPFSSLAKTTVHNTILDALRQDQAGKQRPLNESASISWSSSGSDGFTEIEASEMNLPSSGSGPLEDIEDKEAVSYMLSSMADVLSQLERSVLLASMRGLDISVIAKEKNLRRTQVNGALARARKKLRKTFT